MAGLEPRNRPRRLPRIPSSRSQVSPADASRLGASGTGSPVAVNSAAEKATSRSAQRPEPSLVRSSRSIPDPEV